MIGTAYIREVCTEQALIRAGDAVPENMAEAVANMNDEALRAEHEERVRAMWEARGVDYDELRRWCMAEADEDLRLFLAGLPLVLLQQIAPALSMAYEIAFGIGYAVRLKQDGAA